MQDGKLRVAGSGAQMPGELLERVSRRAEELVDLSSFDGDRLVLLSAQPGTPQALHPHLLAVTKDDYQVAHAGTRHGYMTAELFVDERLSPQALLGAVRPPAGTFGTEQVSALESLIDVLREDLTHGRPVPQAQPPAGIMTRLWRWLVNRNAPQRIPWSFKLVNGHYYYHGTTLFDLTRIVEAGGTMAPEVSQYSMLANDSVGYAYSRQYNLSRLDNPAVLLQFKNEAIAGLVSGESFRSAAVLIDRGMPPNHQSYAIAVKPVPLSLMTRQSKDSILNWIRLQAVRYPEQGKWAELLPKVKKALDP